MRRALASLLVAVSLAGGGTAVAVQGAPVDGGQAAQACYDTVPGAATLNTPQRVPCRFAQQADRQAGADCRVAVTDGSCEAVDGRAVGSAEVAAYQRSWVHRALSLQRSLVSAAPILDTQIVHTHNSFNASAYALNGTSRPSYYPTLTNQDPNQVYSITDQLDMDVRFIEIDLHWVPSVYGNAGTHGYWVTLCHGDGQQAPATGTWVHVGCTADRPAEDGFAELARWLDAHPREFVFVYLENQLYPGATSSADTATSQQQAHDVAASLIQQELGSRVVRPSGATAGHCQDLPYAASVDNLRAGGHHVVLVGNCGPGSAWSSWVFQRGSLWDESGDPTTYSAADCAKDTHSRLVGTGFRRFFEDSTVLASGMQSTSQITPATTAAMVRCGVNIIGMDQLTTDDPRLPALVWSWAPGQPASAGCAVERAGRWYAEGCGTRHHFTCRDFFGGALHVTSAVGPWRAGSTACQDEFPTSTFSMPTNGAEEAALAAVDRGGAWVSVTQQRGSWRNAQTFFGRGHRTSPPPAAAHGRGRGRSLAA